MSEKMIVTHCSPTLAGMKTGNLFSCRCSCGRELLGFTASWNKQLNQRGVYIRVLRFSRGMALIYVYRKAKLAKALEDISVRQFMESCGYDCSSIEGMLDILAERLGEYSEFPHEIGVFLGYPFEDVKAFIVNKGKNYKHVGCWKVYTNESAAKRTFMKYDKCTAIYSRMLDKGAKLPSLTVKSNLICP